jgi:hypothetical protein
MQVHITKRSANAKTGRMPVTTTESSSCPSTCPHINGNCYAKSGFHLAQHWKKVSSKERGGTWDELCSYVSSLKPRQIWRHNQAGDLGYIKDVDGKELIRLDLLKSLVDANKTSKARGYTYTHHKLDYIHNLEAVKYANNNGFTVNASCESLTQCDDAIKQGIPTVCVVDNSKDVPTHTPDGHKVVVCPAQTRDTNCVDCGLCAQSKRTCVVAFLAHGNRAKKLNATLSTLVQNKEVA